MDWAFSDFQSLKPNPDEHRIQPIEASQLERTFVEFGSAVSVLTSVDHQIVFGRRGTGKTHLLTHIRQSRRAVGEMAIQLDLRTIGSNNGIYGDSATSIVQRGIRAIACATTTANVPNAPRRYFPAKPKRRHANKRW